MIIRSNTYPTLHFNPQIVALHLTVNSNIHMF